MKINERLLAPIDENLRTEYTIGKSFIWLKIYDREDKFPVVKESGNLTDYDVCIEACGDYMDVITTTRGDAVLDIIPALVRKLAKENGMFGFIPVTCKEEYSLYMNVAVNLDWIIPYKLIQCKYRDLRLHVNTAFPEMLDIKASYDLYGIADVGEDVNVTFDSKYPRSKIMLVQKNNRLVVDYVVAKDKSKETYAVMNNVMNYIKKVNEPNLSTLINIIKYKMEESPNLFLSLE